MAFDSVLASNGGSFGASTGAFSYGNYPSRFGPLTNSNNHKYAIVNSTDPPLVNPFPKTININKSTDGGRTWAAVAAAKQTMADVGYDLSFDQFCAFPFGDKFYVLCWGFFSDPAHVGDYAYAKGRAIVKVLDTVSETWSVLLAGSFAAGVEIREPGGGIVVKSNGDVSIFVWTRGPDRNILVENIGGSWGSIIETPDWSLAGGFYNSPWSIEVTDSDRIRLFVESTAVNGFTGKLLHACWNGSSFGAMQTIASDIYIRFEGPLSDLGQGLAYTDGAAQKKFALPYMTYDVTPAQDGHITSSSINNPGSSWHAGEEFDVGDGDFNAHGVVDTVDGFGAVLTYHLTNSGTNYTTASAVETFAYDSGINLTLDVVAAPITPLVMNALLVKCLHADDVDSPTWTSSLVESNSQIETPGSGGIGYESAYGTGNYPYVRENKLSMISDGAGNAVLFYAAVNFVSGTQYGQVKRSVWGGSTWATSSVFRSDPPANSPDVYRYYWGVNAIGAGKVMFCRWSGTFADFQAVVEHVYSEGFQGGGRFTFASSKSGRSRIAKAS